MELAINLVTLIIVLYIASQVQKKPSCTCQSSPTKFVQVKHILIKDPENDKDVFPSENNNTDSVKETDLEDKELKIQESDEKKARKIRT